MIQIHSHDNKNNHNDDKAVDVENEIESDNAPENNVEGVFQCYSCEGDEHVKINDFLYKTSFINQVSSGENVVK